MEPRLGVVTMTCEEIAQTEAALKLMPMGPPRWQAQFALNRSGVQNEDSQREARHQEAGRDLPLPSGCKLQTALPRILWPGGLDGDRADAHSKHQPDARYAPWIIELSVLNCWLLLDLSLTPSGLPSVRSNQNNAMPLRMPARALGQQ